MAITFETIDDAANRLFGISSGIPTAIDVTDTVAYSVAALNQVGGTYSFSGGAFDLQPTSANLTIGMDTGYDVTITLADNQADAFLIQEAQAYLSIGTLDAGATIALGNATTNPTITQVGTGQVSFDGNVNASNGVDIDADNKSLTIGAGGDLTIVHDATDTKITSTTGDLVVDNQASTGTTLFLLGSDDLNTAFDVQSDDTTSLLEILGSGVATFSGNVNCSDGLDVTTAAITSSAGITNSGGELLVSGGNLQLNDSIVLGFGTSDDVKMWFDGTNTFTVDQDAGGTATTTLFKLSNDTTAKFAIQQDTGTNEKFSVTGAGLSTFTGDAYITGNLTVDGTMTVAHEQEVNVGDSHFYMNSGAVTDAARSGGMAVNYDPISATADTVNTGGFATVLTVVTTGSATFAASDLIQITGANNETNNGLFEVLTHVGTTLTIHGVGGTGTSYTFIQNNFIVDTTVAGAITKVNVSVIQAGTDGIWETAYGNSTIGWSFADLGSAAGNDLQAAYVQGATINATVGEGDLAFTLTSADFLVDGANDFLIGNTTPLSTFTVDTSGVLELNSSAGVINIGDDAVAQGINVGTGAAARTITVGNATGATALDVNTGTGGVTIDTTDGGAVSIDAIGAPSNFTLTSTAGADDFTVALAGATDSSLILSSTGTGLDAVQVTASAGGMHLDSSAAMELNSSAGVISIGSDAVAQGINVGTGAAARTITVGNVTGATALDVNTGTGGVTIDTTDGGAISIDAIGAPSNFTLTSTAGADDFTVALAGATDSSLILSSTGTSAADALQISTSAGGMKIDSNGSIDMDGGGIVSINSSAGIINIGDDAVSQGIYVGTGAAARTITVGNVTGATALDVNTGTGGVTIDTTDGGAISIDAIGAPSNFTLTSTAGADDFTVALAGATDSSLILSSTGTSATDALQISTSAGGMKIDSSGSIDMDGGGIVSINSSAAAINIGDDAVAQGINVGTGAAARTITVGNVTGATALDVNTGTGGVTIDTTDGGAVSIDAIGAPSNFTLASTAGADDLTIAVTGATDSSLILSSTGTGGDAIQITASAGGIDINLVDNVASALTIQQGANVYLNVATSDGTETVSFGDGTTSNIDLQWFAGAAADNVLFDQSGKDVIFTNVDLHIGDDDFIYFGAGDDVSLEYDSASGNLKAVGALGGAAGSETAGVGYDFASGTGAASDGSKAGAEGGNWDNVLGTGGAASSAGAIGGAGTGGDYTMTAGVGGAGASGANDYDGGIGGLVAFTGGLGGAGGGDDSAGGLGGAITITAGAGGAASGTGDNSDGGDLTLGGGAAGTGGAGAVGEHGTVFIEDNSMFKLPTLTTTTRDLYTPSNGMIIYNDTGGVNEFQAYENGQWVSLGTGSGNTLDEAYDQGGAGAGRTINVTAGAVVFDHSTTDGIVKLEPGLTTAALPALAIDFTALTYTGLSVDGIDVDYGTATLSPTGDMAGLRVDYGDATVTSTNFDNIGLDLIGKVNAGAGSSVGIQVGTGWDTAIDIDSGVFSQTGGTGNIDVAWDFSGGVTNSASEFLVSGGNMQLNDTIVLSLGTGDDLQLVHSGTVSTITNATGDLTVNNTGGDILLETENTAAIGMKQELLIDAGEAAAGDCVAISSTTNTLDKADATTTNALQTVVGIAISTVTVGQEVELALPGSIVSMNTDLGADGATNGSLVYLTTTPGAISKTAPTASGTTVYRVGVVVDQGNDRIMFMPQFITNIP